jgi:hypothetical protein
MARTLQISVNGEGLMREVTARKAHICAKCGKLVKEGERCWQNECFFGCFWHFKCKPKQVWKGYSDEQFERLKVERLGNVTPNPQATALWYRDNRKRVEAVQKRHPERLREAQRKWRRSPKGRAKTKEQNARRKKYQHERYVQRRLLYRQRYLAKREREGKPFNVRRGRVMLIEA